MTGNKYFLLIPLIIVLFSFDVLEVLLDIELSLLVPFKSVLDKGGLPFRAESIHTHRHTHTVRYS